MRMFRTVLIKIFFTLSAFVFLFPADAAAQGRGGRRLFGFFEFLLQPKYLFMLAIGITALAFLLSRKMRSQIKVPLLLLSTFLFGIAANLPVNIFNSFSMHPSPMCAATKCILYGFRIPMIVTLAVILFLTLIGPKLFCGWVCPVGAAQELIAMWADRLKIKRIKWNFVFTQTVRIGVFLLFVFLSGTAILHTVANGQKIPVSVYDYVNAFHGFEIQAQATFFDNIIHFLPFILTLVFAFKFYRPFCYLICPIGLFTNLLEQISLFRITLKTKSCTQCGICEKKSPCPAVPEILKNAVLRPDCFSCDVCVSVSPHSCLTYGIKRQENK